MCHLLFNPKNHLVSHSFPQDKNGKWVALGVEEYKTIICFKISEKTDLIDSGANPLQFQEQGQNDAESKGSRVILLDLPLDKF